MSSPDRHLLELVSSLTFRPAHALRKVLKAGYTRANFRADLMAGLVVGIIAVPLSLALAIASGVPPQHGLYTAIVAGALTAILGGSRYQVSGPTAAFVVILAPIAAKYGLGGLMVATIMAGLFLVLLGVLRMGRLIQFIPYTVTVGFTAGIAVVIATLQMKDFLGLSVSNMPDHYSERVAVLFQALPTTRISDLSIGVLTLTILLLWPRINRNIPGPLVALVAAALAAFGLTYYSTDFSVATINTQFSYILNGVQMHGIPSMPPLPGWPWDYGGAGGVPLHITPEFIREMMPAAFAIAMLGAIESLLSAVIADGMTGDEHDPDTELVGQGVANIVAPFFGGFASTGALARTATNIRSGAVSPIASVIHAVFVFLSIVLLAPLLGYVPMSALAALLLVVAWNMSEIKHFWHLIRIAPRSDVLVLLVCFVLTVFLDMAIAVSVGVVLASLLFMRRMASISEVRLVSTLGPNTSTPPDVFVYQIQGPLFFGAAQKAISQLKVVSSEVSAVIIDFQFVPAIDATGLVNLESLFEELKASGIVVFLVGVQTQPRAALARLEADPNVTVEEDIAAALAAIEGLRAI